MYIHVVTVLHSKNVRVTSNPVWVISISSVRMCLISGKIWAIIETTKQLQLSTDYRVHKYLSQIILCPNSFILQYQYINYTLSQLIYFTIPVYNYTLSQLIYFTIPVYIFGAECNL